MTQSITAQSALLILLLIAVVQEITSKAKRGSIPAYRPRPKAPASVREIMENISEGDLVGNNNASSWRRSLRDRKKVPLKCLTFGATDRRPGYIGKLSFLCPYFAAVLTSLGL